jgi:flagellin
LAGAVVLELAGRNGAEVLSFEAGTSISQLEAGINLLQDATGLTATINGTTLELTSNTYGSKAIVGVNVISEGSGSTPSGAFTTAIGQGTRVAGTNSVATINGVSASADGNVLAINTATLDLQTTVQAETTGTSSFTITGGGALFQLGPDVVTNQQARLGIGSVNTAQLGGLSGKLFSLGSGGTATLALDPTTAASIVEEAINQVTSLRGRLGAFQRTSLETNRNALGDTLVNLTDAESAIRDADFASETAALTRAQILVQSGTTVLQITNQNPQNVLALLR